MATGSGMRTVAAAGIQVDFDTEQTTRIAFDVLSVTPQAKAGIAAVEDLSGYSYGTSEAALVQLDVGGDLVVHPYYRRNALGLLLKWALGACTTTGTGPYTHTMTPAAALAASLEVWRGTSDVTEKFVGMVCDSFSLSWETTGLGKVKATMIGKSAAARGSAARPTMPTTRSPVIAAQMPSVTFNGTAHPVSKLTLSIANKIEQVRDMGSLGIGDAVRGGPVEITLECEINARSSVLYAAHLAKTRAALSLAFTLDGNNSLTISTSAAEIEDYNDGITGSGVVKQRVRWTFRANPATSAPPVTVVLVNGDAAVDAS